MWLVMIGCYLLMGLSFVALALTGWQGYAQVAVFGAPHALVAIATLLLYLFTETLIMFFFIGTGVNIREYVREHHCDPELYARMRRMKMKLFSPIMLNILLVGAAFILGGGADRERVPIWAHGLVFWVALGHFGWVIRIQHRAFRENTNIILAMCGVARPAGKDA